MIETCETCRFRSDEPYTNPDRGTAEFADIMFACRRRAPVATGGMMSPSNTIWPMVTKVDWCGDWAPKAPPLDDRAPTPTPVAVSETPVGKRQSADERIGQGWSKEDFVDRRAAEDPYGPPIPHDGGRCPHCGC